MSEVPPSIRVSETSATLDWRPQDRPAQSPEPSQGRASCLQRCSGSAATEQDLCKTAATEQDLCKSVIATSQVNWATTLDCVPKSGCRRRQQRSIGSLPSRAPTPSATRQPRNLKAVPKTRGLSASCVSTFPIVRGDTAGGCTALRRLFTTP